MKSILVACVGSLLLLSSCAPKTNENEPKLTVINIIDQNGLTETISTPDRIKQYDAVDFLCNQPYKKVMRIYSRDECGNVTAYITSYHPNGQPWQYLEVVNGRAFGMYQEWYANGQLKIEARVISGNADLDTAAQKTWLFEGLCTVWDEQGQKSAEMPYIKGLLEGLCIYYHPCGTIWKSTPCYQGKREGVQQVFMETGELLSEISFCQDEPDGYSHRYWPDGCLSTEESFTRGRLMCGCYWDRQGRMITEVVLGHGKRTLFGKEFVSMIQEYHNGIPEGKVEIYSAKGQLCSFHHVKEGYKHGEEVQLYPGTLEPKLSLNWFQGKVQGVCRTWYKNGQLENQREMSENIKNGLLTAWYRDGSLMLIEEYDHDKLVRGEYYRRGEKRSLTEVHNGRGVATLFDPEGGFVKRIAYMNGLPEP